MKRILIFIILSLIFINGFSQINQVDVKKLNVRNWIIYQGDTLAIVRVSGDTLFVTRGETSLDTMIATTYWTKTGNDIANNNTGKIIMSKDSTYFSGIPDEATKTGRLLHVNQFGKVEYVHFMDLYNDTQDSLALAPTDRGTWLRDTTNGELYQATLTDQVGIGTANPQSSLEVVGNIISEGTSWTSRSSTSDISWQSITYGNGLFVAVGYNGTTAQIMTSPDGVNWTSRTTIDNDFIGVAYGNNRFIAVCDSGTEMDSLSMISYDGVNWDAVYDTISAKNITFGNGMFVKVNQDGGENAAYSYDGLTWVGVTIPNSNLFDICFGNGKFVATSISPKGDSVSVSSNGINWTNYKATVTGDWTGITYGNGLYVAVKNGSGTSLMTSPDAITWTARSFPAGITLGAYSVAYGNGLYVAVTGWGEIATSHNGIDWVERSDPGRSYKDIVYANGMFVAIASDGTGNRIASSGITNKHIPQNNDYFRHKNIYADYEINSKYLLKSLDSLYVEGDAEFDEDVNVGGNLDIPATTSTIGQFTRNKTRFLHLYTDNAAQPNLFIGENAGNFTTTGNYNYTLGNNALAGNTTGSHNFAGGMAAAFSNTEGSYNFAIGGNTLYYNKTGTNNVAVGYGAQYGVSLDNVSNSVSIGTEAALNNMGDGNIAIGTNAMSGGGSSTGADNVCIGALVMYPKTTGSRNVGVGKESLRLTAGGSYNTGIGFQSLYTNASGTNNLGLGYSAGKYITGSYKGCIDVEDMGSYANDTTQSLLFMNYATNKLRINGITTSTKGTIANNDDTPDVSGANVFEYNGTANSVSIVSFDNHIIGAFYTIIGNSETYTITIIDGTPAGGDSFNLSGSNWVGGNDDVLVLYCISADNFIEVSRSDN